ncbi:hypothetical protein ACYOEI_09925, partial [Singulisphaera rosea]
MTTATLSAVLLTHDTAYLASVKDATQDAFETIMAANLAAKPTIEAEAVSLQDNAATDLVTFEAIVAFGVKLAALPKAEVLEGAQAIGL